MRARERLHVDDACRFSLSSRCKAHSGSFALPECYQETLLIIQHGSRHSEPGRSQLAAEVQDYCAIPEPASAPRPVSSDIASHLLLHAVLLPPLAIVGQKE